MPEFSRVAELRGFYGPHVAAGDAGVWAAASPVAAAVWSGGELTVGPLGCGGLIGEVVFSEDGRSLLAAPYVLELGLGAFSELPRIAPALAEGLGEEAERGFSVHASVWSADLEYLMVYAEYRPSRELGRAAVYTGPDKRLLLLEGRTRRVLRVLWEGSGWQSYRALAFGGDRIAAATSAISIWASAGGGVEPGGHESAVRALRFSLDGSRLASIAADGSAGLWDPRGAGAADRRWAAHEGDASALALHPKLPLLATGGLDGSLRLWSYGAERLGAVEFDGAVEGAAFSADGRELLVACGAPAERLFVYRVEL